MTNSPNHSRRDFLKKLGITGSAICMGFGGIFTMAGQDPKNKLKNIEYKYSTFSTSHLQEIEEWFEKLKSEDKIGKNETFRGYLSGFKYDFSFKNVPAKSVLMISVPWHICSIVFNVKGEKHEILIPSGYTDSGFNDEAMNNRLRKDFNIGKEYYLEFARLPYKTVAAKSGLTRYGLNNISFVEEYGSYHELVGYYTDKELDDNWGKMKTLHECKGCNICYDNCPTKCIKRDNFIINVDDCVTLYNEQAKPIPDHIDPNVHNALVGCLKCQFDCPANGGKIKQIEKLAELTEEETDFILNVGTDKDFHNKLIKKLEKFYYVKNLEYFSRNLKLVLQNSMPV